MENIKLETAGQRIRYVRKLHKMKQSDFALALGTTIKSISDVEQGKIRPNFDILTQLHVVYNVSFDFIFMGQGDPFCTDDKAIVDLTEEGIIRHEEILVNVELRNFLEHLLGSRIVLQKSLQFFSEFYRGEHRAIKKEMEESNNK